MIISAIYVKSTKEILYSRYLHDFRWSKDQTVGIDGGREYTKVSFTNIDDFVSIKLDGKVLLEQILEYDWKYGNKYADKWKDGYYGRFEITENSNLDFFKKLIINFEDIEYFI